MEFLGRRKGRQRERAEQSRWCFVAREDEDDRESWSINRERKRACVPHSSEVRMHLQTRHNIFAIVCTAVATERAVVCMYGMGNQSSLAQHSSACKPRSGDLHVSQPGQGRLSLSCGRAEHKKLLPFPAMNSTSVRVRAHPRHHRTPSPPATTRRTDEGDSATKHARRQAGCHIRSRLLTGRIGLPTCSTPTQLAFSSL